MRVIVLDDITVPGLRKQFGIETLWALVSDDGTIEREIGFIGEDVQHTFPGKGSYGQYGILDSNKFSDCSIGTIDERLFWKVWNNYSL